jgi:hypothetical protein
MRRLVLDVPGNVCKVWQLLVGFVQVDGLIVIHHGNVGVVVVSHCGRGGRRSKKGCAGSCKMLFCWPFLVSRQTVKLMVPVWYLFLRWVIVITGKETRNGQFLHEKKVFAWEHFGKSVPIGTLFLLLESNLRNSTVTWNTFPKVFQREHFSQSAPTYFFFDSI